MRRIFSLVAALALAVVLPLQALAAPLFWESPHEPPTLLRYSYTGSITAGLSISNGKASCSGIIDPDNGYYASIRVVLYRSSNGRSWTQIASWSGSSSTAGLPAAASGSKSISSGYKYKVTAFGTVKDSDGDVMESPSKTTAIKSY